MLGRIRIRYDSDALPCVRERRPRKARTKPPALVPTGRALFLKREKSMSHALDFLFRPVSVLDAAVLFWLFIKWHAVQKDKS